jgi:hypothetical protein
METLESDCGFLLFAFLSFLLEVELNLLIFVNKLRLLKGRKIAGNATLKLKEILDFYQCFEMF